MWPFKTKKKTPEQRQEEEDKEKLNFSSAKKPGIVYVHENGSQLRKVIKYKKEKEDTGEHQKHISPPPTYGKTQTSTESSSVYRK